MRTRTREGRVAHEARPLAGRGRTHRGPQVMDPLKGEIRLVHIGVIVHRIDAAIALYRRLGLPETGRETLAQENVRIAFVDVPETRIELLEPLTAGGPLDRFLAARGEGIHHLALEVPDIGQAMARARAAGLRLIDDAPREGAHRTKVAFIHPTSSHGVMIELVERSRTP